ncbi:hypothetical protein MNBD_GAMMA10-1152 [hydrothermal vent metagenome]|uniref:Uncharacterized protein n=1 Tax=hydrothermal vent metagenome TaxID=652676 RepID=A0A3B0Y8G2_9ZZZZ
MMNHFFCFITNRPDTREDIRKRGFSECVKNTHSRIALCSIRATTLRTIHRTIYDEVRHELG